jgi:hypothetical protein
LCFYNGISKIFKFEVIAFPLNFLNNKYISGCRERGKRKRKEGRKGRKEGKEGGKKGEGGRKEKEGRKKEGREGERKMATNLQATSVLTLLETTSP